MCFAKMSNGQRGSRGPLSTPASATPCSRIYPITITRPMLNHQATHTKSAKADSCPRQGEPTSVGFVRIAGTFTSVRSPTPSSPSQRPSSAQLNSRSPTRGPLSTLHPSFRNSPFTNLSLSFGSLPELYFGCILNLLKQLVDCWES